jgi:hypothetical protein
MPISARWLEADAFFPSGQTAAQDHRRLDLHGYHFFDARSRVAVGLHAQCEVDMSRMISESVNNAVSMAQCAVALFEAQAQDWHTETDRPRLYPESLKPTRD